MKGVIEIMVNPMKYIFTTTLFVLITGCASTGSIQRNLQSQQGELNYLQDSVKVGEKQNGTMNISSFVVDNVLPASTSVEVKDSSVYPFLIFNRWTYNYQSNLGYEQIKNDYKKFIQESFVEELKRSAKFRYVEEKGDMEIDVRIKTITMTAPICQNGAVLFLLISAAYNQTTVAGPVDTVVTADVVVKQYGKLLWSKEFKGNHKINILADNYRDKEAKYLQDYAIAMIEDLSLAIKNLNENIVNEINTIGT